MITEITEQISYIKSTKNPLSSDVGIVKGEQNIWLYDVGASEGAFHLLREVINSDKEVNAVLSHFHYDHTGNIKRIGLINDLYVSSKTYTYTHCGQIVREDLYIEDGVQLHIFPLPSSHAKGCLGLEVNDAYAFLGDATYSTTKGNQIVYNVSQLAEEIHVLEKLKAKYFMLSHQSEVMQKKENVLKQLRKIYERKKNGDPYIVLYH